MDRLLEPSTWAGLSAILGTVAGIVPGTASFALGGFAAAFGSIAVFLRERGAA
jgi:hypothetical protein